LFPSHPYTLNPTTPPAQLPCAPGNWGERRPLVGPPSQGPQKKTRPPLGRRVSGTGRSHPTLLTGPRNPAIPKIPKNDEVSRPPGSTPYLTGGRAWENLLPLNVLGALYLPNPTGSAPPNQPQAGCFPFRACISSAPSAPNKKNPARPPPPVFPFGNAEPVPFFPHNLPPPAAFSFFGPGQAWIPQHRERGGGRRGRGATPLIT